MSRIFNSSSNRWWKKNYFTNPLQIWTALPDTERVTPSGGIAQCDGQLTAVWEVGGSSLLWKLQVKKRNREKSQKHRCKSIRINNEMFAALWSQRFWAWVLWHATEWGNKISEDVSLSMATYKCFALSLDGIYTGVKGFSVSATTHWKLFF